METIDSSYLKFIQIFVDVGIITNSDEIKAKYNKNTKM